MALIFLDLATGGLDPATDRILEIAAVRVDAQLAPVDGFATVVLPNPGIAPCAPGWAWDTHTANGLLGEIAAGQGVNLATAQGALLEWLTRQGDRLHTLAGDSVGFDLAFLRAWVPLVAARFHGSVWENSTFVQARDLAGLPSCPIDSKSYRAQPGALAALGRARWHLSRVIA